MRSRVFLALTALILPLAAGCSGAPEPAPQPVAKSLAHQMKPDPVLRREPPPPPPPTFPFPPSALSLDQAERVLDGDTMALRFLTLRALAEAGLVDADGTDRRKAANIGALMPLTGGRNPAAELELPVPPVEAVVARFHRLKGSVRGPASALEAERAFLLDQLLPLAPSAGIVMAPHDKIQARQLLDRLGRLEKTGLITGNERARESEAVETLMATLPDSPPPPPPPKKKKVAAKAPAGLSGGRRMPGGVSGRLEVIPSPFEFEPPKITADFTGQAGAHLLSMASSDHGARAWTALKNQFSFELGSHSYVVERADLGSLGVTHRLIAGPMDAQAAERLCGALRAKGQACMPTPFPSVAPVPAQ